ncbi:MAG: hypothetical protein WAZ98_12880 [Cyclobacteriaceae bacterium]
MVKQLIIPAYSLVLAISLTINTRAVSQELYTARGYWVEATKETYRNLIQKQTVGDSLTTNEITYIQDYKTYLDNYFNRLSDSEKIKYEQMKPEWDREILTPRKPEIVQEEFEWRPRDRVINALYGMYYGTSIVYMADLENAAAAGIPLITGGLWLMGPVFNPKRYEGITRTTVRAGHTGKFLGLIYGGALGAAVAGESEHSDKWLLGLSTVGSIALGEVGFQLSKKRNYTDGHVELMRHYGILGPWITTSILISADADNAHWIGASLLAGGAAGLFIGNSVSKRYNYTKGDVDAISSLSVISTGIGLTLMAESFENTEQSSLILIPAAGTILGTLWGQKIVKNAYLTKKQGSTIGFSTAGAALIGLGIVAVTEIDSPIAAIGIPTGLALITHQLLFYTYKRDNLTNGLQGSGRRKNKIFQFSMNVMPENYFFNQKLPVREYNPQLNNQVSNPLVKLKLTF